ncbi:hypothetical protein, partial [Bacillus cereus]|uniref:hypothetical protein n=1 Tax=Bacillus cereus TaxID=1396 RepID=UPI0030131E40
HYVPKQTYVLQKRDVFFKKKKPIHPPPSLRLEKGVFSVKIIKKDLTTSMHGWMLSPTQKDDFIP